MARITTGSMENHNRPTTSKIIEQQIKPLIGNYKLSKLDKITYKQAYIDELLKKYSINTVKLYHRIFKICVNGAVDNEIITRNRFTKIIIKIQVIKYMNPQVKMFEKMFILQMN